MDEVDLYNEIVRENPLTYSPIASVCRRELWKDIEVNPLINKNNVASLWKVFVLVIRLMNF